MSIDDKQNSIKKRRTPNKLAVKSAVNLTPNMRRVTLHGDCLATFPPNSEGAILKLLFEQPGDGRSIKRTYTLAKQRSEPNEIDVDFMLHTGTDCSSHGIAAPWSLDAQPNDEISFFGPGPAKFINLDAECFLLAADMTALPALTANLKLLPANARGKAFIEILSEADKQDLQKPENVDIAWVINEAPGSDKSPLFHAIHEAEWQTGKLAVWAACEFITMKKIRQFLKVERGIEKSHLYIASYWKKGATGEEHKIAEQADASE